MREFKVDLDISGLTQYLDNFVKEISKDVKQSIKALANDTHNHIKEEAQSKLHSFRESYLENLSPPEEIDKNVWVITLNEKAEWIETGRAEPFDMKPGLLKKGKMSKDGVMYRVVPMDQAKAPSQMTVKKGAYEKGMVALVRSELRKKGINYKKLEVETAIGRKTGNIITNKPKIGKLHSLDIDSNIPGKGNTPQLHGLNIYQKYSNKTNKVERQITTFRTVTNSSDQSDKWIHPPVDARNFFDNAKKWAETEWETKILPALMDKYK